MQVYNKITSKFSPWLGVSTASNAMIHVLILSRDGQIRTYVVQLENLVPFLTWLEYNRETTIDSKSNVQTENKVKYVIQLQWNTTCYRVWNIRTMVMVILLVSQTLEGKHCKWVSESQQGTHACTHISVCKANFKESNEHYTQQVPNFT